MVVNLLNEEDIPARSDATAAMPVFGGLPFESGHVIFVPASQAKGPARSSPSTLISRT